MVINEFGELRGQVKPFMGDDVEIDSMEQAVKKRRMKGKAPDTTGAFDDPDAIDID